MPVGLLFFHWESPDMNKLRRAIEAQKDGRLLSGAVRHTRLAARRGGVQAGGFLKRVSGILGGKKSGREDATASVGSAHWLVSSEEKYGGIITDVPRNKVSPKDPRTQQELDFGGMMGGDRMQHHGYAALYAEYLGPFVGRSSPLTVAEFGILQGSGLAIWCDLFEDARVIGFDIDLGHIEGNRRNLLELGAFQRNEPELYELDQLEENEVYLGDVLKGDKIDVCIDDGLHSFDSILTTIESVIPHLADDFVYFVEDNAEVHSEIARKFSEFTLKSDGEMTILTRA
jgi:hypothetical protein